MSRSVLEVVNEAIEKVKIAPIGKPYVEVLEDFYSGYCVIDQKRSLVPKCGKYSKTYSCFNSNRQNSELEINITNNDVIRIEQICENLTKKALLSPCDNSLSALESDILKIGVLTLFEISDKSNDDTLMQSRVIINANGAVIEKEKKEKHFKESFSYDHNTKILLCYSDSDEPDYAYNLEMKDAISKIYSAYKKVGTK